MRIRQWVARGAACLLLIAGGYAGYSAVRAHRTVSLAPSGPFEVGRTTNEWQNLSVWLWYPVAPGTPGTAAPYAPGQWNRLHKFGIGQTSFGRVATGTLVDAPIAPGSFPIVVLLPGLGFSAPQYASIASSLAARGYLVAGVTPRSSTSPAGDQLVAIWSADARFAAQQVASFYAGSADTRHVVYVGHSFGGAASLEACRTDPACAGAADLDGTPYGPVVTDGLDKPLLLLSSGGDDGAANDSATKRLFAASGGPAYGYVLDGARHFDFTDYAAYYLAFPLRLALPLGSLDGRRALTITNGYLGAFADRAARGTQWTAPTYPEIHPAAMLGG